MSVSASIFSSFHSKRYTLLEPCGQGGSSVVFKARDKQTNQTVAIKVFADSSTDNALLNRETQFSSLLQHPHIIRLLDKGLAQNFHYAVFEYIQGKPLKQVLFEAERLSPTQISELMRQVLSALWHCHQLGVIHRDVKPSNILVTDYCGELHATLIDFGSATFDQNRRNQDDVDFSATQSIPLSPAYCAPSLLTGGQANQHSDLYSWGLILLECLSGKHRLSSPAEIKRAVNELQPANTHISNNLVCHPIQWLLQRVFSIDMPEGALNTSELYNLFVQLDFSSINQTARLTEPQASNVKQQNLDNTQSIQPASYAQPTTEQKQITALCLNLAVKKSLDIASQVSSYEESEFLSALQKSLQAQCVDIAQRYGATHVSTLGDTLLFYFGYPVVTASDCYLSAKTAKQIIDFLIQRNNQLSQEQQIVCSSSIGIHSGLVTIKNDTIPEGETPNIAISVARLANNNQILCTRATREMLSSDFDFKVYEVVNLGHKQRPQSLHTMLGNRQVSKQQANQPARNVRLFVGRKKELAQLSSFFDGITPHEPAQQHIHISGEAGIGKSRLIFECRQQSKVKTQIITHCVPEHKTQTLQPIFALLISKYCLNSCCEGSALTLLRQEIASHSDLNHDTAMYLMCSYLGYALPNQYACSLMSSRETQNILFECLSYLLCKKPNAKSSGVKLIIIEDIDSIDVTSIEFLQHLKSSSHFINSNSCLMTSSSKNISGFGNDNSVSHIQLERFSQEESTSFVSQLFNGLCVTDLFANLIYERTDGNPLFIIKFMNMLKDKGDISILDNKLYLRSTKDILTLPDCLRDTLQDKLDHLQSAKKITQLASIIGLEFDLELLAASYAGDNKQLQMMLDELLNENLIESRPGENGHTFAFKHPLLCETAYTSVPENQRRAIHSRVASVLETKQRTSKKEQLSLALQWLKAGHQEKSNRPASK